MDKFIMVDANLFALIMCLLILTDVCTKFEIKPLQSRLFIWLVAGNVLFILIDSGAWLVNGHPGAGYVFFNYAFNYALYLVMPLPAFLWSLYAHWQLRHDENRLKKAWKRLLIPYAAYIAVLALNPFTNGIFVVHANGFYERGPLVAAAQLFSYLYVAYAFVLIVRERKNLDRRNFVSLMLFAVPPSVAGVAQALVYGLPLLGPGVTVSLFIVYMNIQNRRIYTDYLTGVFNRREADSHVKSRVNGDMGFSAILADIDRFKEINDQFGHKTGDEALETVADIVRGTLRAQDFLARYGGDEFLIVLDIADPQHLRHTAERIAQAIQAFNETSKRPYRLSLSMGYDVFDRKSGMNADQFLKHIDTLMYGDKSEKQRGIGGKET